VRGVEPASTASPYAADYGTREAEAELAKLEPKASKSTKGKVKATA
jgi:hypothetical protein